MNRVFSSNICVHDSKPAQALVGVGKNNDFVLY